MAGIAPVVALLLAGSAAQHSVPEMAVVDLQQDSGDSESLDVKTDRERRMTVAVGLEGQGPYRFLIDTGSQRTVVSTGIADQLGLEAGPFARIVSVAGTDIVRTAYVTDLSLGRRHFSDVMVPLLESRNMGADGIIGTDSLQGQRVLLDFKRGTIEIGDKRSLGGNRGYEIVVRARRRAGQLVVTNAHVDGIRTTIVVDTGAGTSVGNRALQRALNKRGNPNAVITLTSVTGDTIEADLGFARKLDIRDISITNLIIAFTDTPAFSALDMIEKPALFLGMRELRLFQRVAIDFSTRRLMFDIPAKQ